jgi:lipopolysaccharide/colanic/teichoic acid biosynthesis glycosyltransferase
MKRTNKTEMLDGYSLGNMVESKSYTIIKRAIDLMISLVFLIVCAPLIIIISFAIKLESPGPVFYRQKRIGKNGKHFFFIRFRAMYVSPDSLKYFSKIQNALNESGYKRMPFIKDDIRVTQVGKFLRRLSLDELPQILCIFRGDMSLVGPRPALLYEWKMYTEKERMRVLVKPGITGLWQVSHSMTSNFEDMINLDIQYIRRRSIILDLKILLKTIPLALFGHR